MLDQKKFNKIMRREPLDYWLHTKDWVPIYEKLVVKPKLVFSIFATPTARLLPGVAFIIYLQDSSLKNCTLINPPLMKLCNNLVIASVSCPQIVTRTYEHLRVDAPNAFNAIRKDHIHSEYLVLYLMGGFTKDPTYFGSGLFSCKDIPINTLYDGLRVFKNTGYFNGAQKSSESIVFDKGFWFV